MDLDNAGSPREVPDASIPLPLALDLRYNVIVCTECCTGIAFDHIKRHLRSTHGIKKRLDDILVHLNIDTPTLSSAQIKAWISEVWILDRGIDGVPVKD